MIFRVRFHYTFSIRTATRGEIIVQLFTKGTAFFCMIKPNPPVLASLSKFSLGRLHRLFSISRSSLPRLSYFTYPYNVSFDLFYCFSIHIHRRICRQASDTMARESLNMPLAFIHDVAVGYCPSEGVVDWYPFLFLSLRFLAVLFCSTPFCMPALVAWCCDWE